MYFPDSVDSYSVGDFYSFRSSFLKKYSIVSKWEPEHNHQKPNQLQLGSDFRVHYKTTLWSRAVIFMATFCILDP